MNKKSTKKALILSALSLVVCISMLIGATFAWFTDSVTSGRNTIQSGNLDVELYYTTDAAVAADPDSNAWIKVDANTDTFGHDNWEPGYTKVTYFKVENEGSLALKYKLSADVYTETAGINKDGDSFLLSDYIKTAVVDIDATRDDILAMAGTDLKDSFSMRENYLSKDSAEVVGLAIWMPTTVGNEANHNGTAPSIEFEINLLAAQFTAESDSFDIFYDEFADYDGEISGAASLEAALQNGGSYKFVGDVTVPAGILPVVPEGVTVVLDLAGNDLSAENVETEYALNNLGKLTIWDSTAIASTYSLRSTPAATINARGIYNGYDKDGNYVSDAEITVLNGTINAKGTNGGAAIYNYGKVTIESGTFTSAGGYALNNQTGAEMIIKNASVTGGVYNCGDLTIENSTVYQHISGRHAVYNWSANLVINSGSFDSISGNELILADGQGASVTINGGTFDKTAKSWLFGAATGKNITFDIYGGTFNGYVNMPEGTVDGVRPYGDLIVIYGGSFNFDPTKYLAEGLQAIKVGNTYTIVPNSYKETDYAGLYKDGNTFYVYTAAGFEGLNKMFADKSAGRDAHVKLMADIDMTGKTWTPVDSYADSAFEIEEFDGQGHTISNLTINGQAMFTRFAGFGDVTFKNVTFDNATVNSNGNLNTSILTVQTYQNVLLDNVDVKNSSITGGYKVAPLIGTVYDEKTTSITATIKNCDVSDTVVTSTTYDFFTCGMVAFVYVTNNDYVEYENCSVTNVQLRANSGGYDYHANIHYTSADTDDQINEHPEVKVTNVTFEAL